MRTGIKVGDAMTEKPVILTSDNSLRQCAQTMNDMKVSAVIVQDKDELAGIITEKDIVRKIVAKGKNPLELSIKDLMDHNVRTIGPNEDIFTALVKMRDLNIRHLPVMEGKKMVGLLTLKDVLKIQPQLFELLVHKFEIREEERKPLKRMSEKEGVCELCGEYTSELLSINKSLVCEDCKDQV
ncbi:MAG: CBS domain-containing protein [Candidatus Woesearchaeota archaeon]